MQHLTHLIPLGLERPCLVGHGYFGRGRPLQEGIERKETRCVRAHQELNKVGGRRRKQHCGGQQTQRAIDVGSRGAVGAQHVKHNRVQRGPHGVGTALMHAHDGECGRTSVHAMDWGGMRRRDGVEYGKHMRQDGLIVRCAAHALGRCRQEFGGTVKALECGWIREENVLSASPKSSPISPLSMSVSFAPRTPINKERTPSGRRSWTDRRRPQC